MLDEVQTGIGRTGQWFAFQHYGVTPDVMSLAKGLGGGVPIGACVAKGEAATLFKPGSHGSTFGGNLLACAAGLATLGIIEDEKLCQNATDIGNFLRAGFAKALAETPGIKDIRGQGMMTGIELDRPCGELVKTALDAGLLINVTADNVVRLVPPLNMTRENAQQLIDGLTPLIRTFLAQPAAAAAA